ncbi:Hypothetical protein D9617_112g092320 [Elsinoe fawcettii]|nr:Hypothetical protein D9617_112g092320 [Elsinoe fawcettii]
MTNTSSPMIPIKDPNSRGAIAQRRFREKTKRLKEQNQAERSRLRAENKRLLEEIRSLRSDDTLSDEDPTVSRATLQLFQEENVSLQRQVAALEVENATLKVHIPNLQRENVALRHALHIVTQPLHCQVQYKSLGDDDNDEVVFD